MPVTRPDDPPNYQVPRPGILWNRGTGPRLPQDGGKKRHLKPKKAPAGESQAQAGSGGYEAIISAAAPPAEE